MTRINCGIPPAELSSKHLIAEHREIKRIPNCIKHGRFNLNNQPAQFTLGTGHVKFFYNKLQYLKDRYEQLYEECKKRGFNVTYFGGSWDGIPNQYMGNYTPTAQDAELIRMRIREKTK